MRNYPVIDWKPGTESIETSVNAAIAFIRAATPAAFGQMTGNVIDPDDPNGWITMVGTMSAHLQNLLLALKHRGVDVDVPSLSPKVAYVPVSTERFDG